MYSKIKKQIVTHPGSDRLINVTEVISGRYEQFKGARFIEPHRRKSFVFFLVKTGTISHSIDFMNYTCAPGDIFFMAPQEVYLFEEANDFGGIGISFKPEFLSSAESALPVIQNPSRINMLSPDRLELPFLSSLAENILTEFNAKQDLSEKLLNAYLITLLIYLSRLYIHQNRSGTSTGGSLAIVDAFRGFIEKYWKDLDHVSDYARLLCITAGHLNQLVKQSTGKKAIEIIQEKKLIEAKRLLLYSTHSVKEIAFLTGFEDPAYFNRFFKKWSGTTPRQFREQIRKKSNTSA